MLLWTIIIVLSVALDFRTKKLVAGGMELYERIPVIKGVFELEYIRNEGAAWGILSDHRWVFMAITAIAIVILPIILYKYRNLHFLFGFSLSLIIGGAIGNMIDRIFLGYVIDFIYLPFLNVIFGPSGFPRFNIADSCAVVGVILMFIYLVFIDKTFFADDKKKKQPSEETKNDET